ncbi:YlbF family regulator [Streptococcus halichoeri]|uniref:YlbF family regulator n=2 Tax=Streptococcus halichoeri TaxID=254785 RepID=UPI00135A1457|nr:YlbF family regulator [Streptococcus halichoeri]
MSDYELALAHLITRLKQHPSILAYHAAKQELDQLPALSKKAYEMKVKQQDGIIFTHIAKDLAAEQSLQRAQSLARELDQHPLVEAYRAKMQDASDLLHHITQMIEEELNKEF